MFVLRHLPTWSVARPDHEHDSESVGTETRKGDFAVKPMGFQAVLTAIEADGSEYAHFDPSSVR